MIDVKFCEKKSSIFLCLQIFITLLIEGIILFFQIEELLQVLVKLLCSKEFLKNKKTTSGEITWFFLR
jgi:hypothetical protein